VSRGGLSLGSVVGGFGWFSGFGELGI
jgi:hypothetical protein